jgi:hypothetical protein
MIWQAYNEDTIHPIERFHVEYPTDLREALQDEEARIQAQFAEATPETIEESNREHVVLESLEVHEDLNELQDFLKEINERKRRLLEVIRTEDPPRVAYECREHIRRMACAQGTVTPEMLTCIQQTRKSQLNLRPTGTQVPMSVMVKVTYHHIYENRKSARAYHNMRLDSDTEEQAILEECVRRLRGGSHTELWKRRARTMSTKATDYRWTTGRMETW